MKIANEFTLLLKALDWNKIRIFKSPHGFRFRLVLPTFSFRTKRDTISGERYQGTKTIRIGQKNFCKLEPTLVIVKFPVVFEFSFSQIFVCLYPFSKESPLGSPSYQTTDDCANESTQGRKSLG